jgi:transcriptional regulator GlxA family with amidase domain
MRSKLVRVGLVAVVAGVGSVGATAQAGQEPSPRTRKVAIVVYDHMEILDFAGPGEVFQSTGGAFDVYTVAESAEPILSQGFVRIVPDFTIDTAPRPDILVIPGGGTSGVQKSTRMMEWIGRSAREAELTLTVCTGAFILARTGLLDGLHATTWHGAIARLREAAPKVIVHENVRFVDNGKYLTTAGVSAGIDGSLHVVSRLLGEDVARATARYMEYDKWDPRAGLVARREVREEIEAAERGRLAREAARAVKATVEDGVQVVPIVVSDDGYSPAVIALEAGVPTRLVFDRKTSSRCLERVVLPDLEIGPVSLPYGRKTAVEFTPEHEGRFRFACGMDMFRGTLLVER